MAKKKSDELDLMTMAEACLELKVSRKTVYRMIAAELLTAPTRFGQFRQYYFRRSVFIEECRRALG